jgi:hypothetical protein
VNARWRICFSFRNGDAYDVEIVDCRRSPPDAPRLTLGLVRAGLFCLLRWEQSRNKFCKKFAKML